ncbi:MAG: hypothetical protein M3541_14165 [Acidobacteriota bacterium]|nr:hypothetical protein [Acidobacteriota bacterium]MDQ3419899.1 hypothetical protein [Acidobacteriota bacterium]
MLPITPVQLFKQIDLLRGESILQLLVGLRQRLNAERLLGAELRRDDEQDQCDQRGRRRLQR